MMQIQKLQAKDADLAKELFRLFQSDDQVSNPTQASEGYIEKLLNKSDFHALVASDGKLLLGGLTAYEVPKYKDESTDMFLYEISVKSEHRQKGIGKKLAMELLALCKNKGIKKLSVITTRYNIAALELFKDLGGQPDMDSIQFSFNIS